MKCKNILVFSIVAIMLSIVVSFVYAEDKVDLKLRLEKGQSYKTRTVNDMKINITIPGQPQAMTMNQKNEMKTIYTVEDVQADSTFVLKVTYDAMVFKMENPDPNQRIEYDSADTSVYSDNPMASIFDAIVGQNLIITISPDGHVKEIKGADTLFESIQEKLNELPDEQMRAGIETSLKTQYGEETLKQNMENSFNHYPDNPVGIGDTWQRKTTKNQGFPVVIDAIYTLKERKDGVAIIDIFAMIQTDRDAVPTEMGPNKIQYNMSGNVTGIVEIQESTGWPIRSKQNLRLSGNMIVQNPETQQPMSIPMSMSGPITQEPY